MLPRCSVVTNPPAKQELQVQFPGWEDPLEKEMSIHSSILARKISWTEEPRGLQSVGSQSVRHDWACIHSVYNVTAIINRHRASKILHRELCVCTLWIKVHWVVCGIWIWFFLPSANNAGTLELCQLCLQVLCSTVKEITKPVNNNC